MPIVPWEVTRPLGPVKWPWFVLLSLVGGLGFSLPLYYWLNQRRSRPGAWPERRAGASRARKWGVVTPRPAP